MARTRKKAPVPTVPDSEVVSQQKPVATKLEPNNSNPIREILVANHRRAMVIIPRSFSKLGEDKSIEGLQKSSLESLRFNPGVVTRVDAEIWKQVKTRNRMVRGFLEDGILSETNLPVESEVVMSARNKNFQPPEHLWTEEERSGKTTLEINHASNQATM